MNTQLKFHCEFRDCKCKKFILHCNNLCYSCQHSIIWHSKKSKPPSDEYLSFCSDRRSARRPRYTHISPIQVAIFIPEAKAIQVIDNIDESRYCINIDSLPI